MFDREERMILANGLQFHVELSGEGPWLVLIMGLGASGAKWDANRAVYEKHFRCVTIDNRGAGRSDKPQAASYSTDEMAKDVLGIMDALGIKRAHINGISMGGAIAQKLAACHPERINALILTSTFAYASRSFCRAIDTLCQCIDILDPALLKQLNQWMTFSLHTQNTRPEFLEEMRRQDAAAPYPMPIYAYKAQCGACISHDARGQLENILAPTLIASGMQDLFAPPDQAHELHARIANSQLYFCENGGHVHEWEYLEAYNRITLDFLLAHS